MKHLSFLLLLTMVLLHGHAQVPIIDTLPLAIPDKLEIEWRYFNNDTAYAAAPRFNDPPIYYKVRHSVLLPDSSLVIGYLNITRDSFRLMKINKVGEMVLRKEYTGLPAKGVGFSMIPDRNNQLIVVMQTETLSDGRSYGLVLAKFNPDLNLLAWVLRPQQILLPPREYLVDALVLDNGRIVVGMNRFLGQIIYDFLPPGTITSYYYEQSAVVLKFFDSLGTNYANQVFPPQDFFGVTWDFQFKGTLYNIQLKSLAGGVGGKFYAVATQYNTSSWSYRPTGIFRMRDIVTRFTDTGAAVKTVSLTTPQLFSDLQPVDENNYTYGIAARWPGSDSLLAVDRDLSQMPANGFPMIPIAFNDTRTSTISFVNQYRPHPDSSVYYFYRDGQWFGKLDFSGNRVWWADPDSSFQTKVPEIAHIQNITPLGRKAFLLEGYDKGGRLTLLKLKERETVTAALAHNNVPVMRNPVMQDKSGVFKVFPVPATDHLNVALPDTFSGGVIVTIHDNAGRLVKTEKVAAGSLIRLDISSFTQGYYLLTIYNAKGQSLQSSFVK